MQDKDSELTRLNPEQTGMNLTEATYRAGFIFINLHRRFKFCKTNGSDKTKLNFFIIQLSLQASDHVSDRS